jgi:hypothetical protein
VTHRIDELHQGPRREPIPEQLRLQVARRQEFNCASCGDETQKYEIHHKQAVAHHGQTCLNNLEMLCPPCHNQVTERQNALQAPRRCTCSVMNPSWRSSSTAPRSPSSSAGDWAQRAAAWCSAWTQ